MDLPELVTPAAEHPLVAALRHRLTTRPAPILQVGPLLAAARPYAIAGILAEHASPLIVVTATPEQAAQVCDDLGQWLGESRRILIFPNADALPYEHMSVGDDVVGSRLQALQALHAGTNPVIVAPIKALLQPSLPPSDLARATQRLTIGEHADLQPLVARWDSLGYTRTPIVEAVGEWSLRGGIVDIWPPTDEYPVRIEFFGDEVESLRRFDPLTQRSEKRERSAEIGPPHDVPFWEWNRAAQLLNQIATDQLRPEVRTEWEGALERLAQGLRFEGRAFYTPLFFDPDQRCNLLNYLPDGSTVVFFEAREIQQAAHDMHQRAEETRSRLIADGEIPAGFPRPYLLWEDLHQQGSVTYLDLSNQPLNEATGEPILPSALPFTLDPPLFSPAQRWAGQLERALEDVARRRQLGERVVIVSPQKRRIEEVWQTILARPAEGEDAPAADVGDVEVIHGTLGAGWTSPPLGITLLTDTELWGFAARRPIVTRRRRQERDIDRQAFLQQLKPNDYVVHIEHGIAVYEGLRRIEVDGKEREFLHLRYASGDALYVPIDQIDRVSKYIGGSDSIPALNRLGSADWERVKRKVKAAVEALARELLALYAARQVAQRPAYPPDTQWQRELEDGFPYVETDDQLAAIESIKRDLVLTRPMDRLICGDVGYGKTEVAVRAAFKVVQDGKQVVVLVPTTVLAQQHLDTFRKRMAAFPVEIEMLSRFRTPREQTAIVDRLRKGQVDIVIGTHRLLSRDVEFKDLGLVIVDEEQRFGVKHKERLKTMRTAVDVLTLTATPIPRTLHMAMAGLRDLSVIDTPPEDRVPIKTYIVPYEDNLVRDAIRRELGRGGQVFFVHNRVQSIYSVLERLRNLLPEVRFLVGHGQMEEKELERVMFSFFAGEADVLLATTIIESGLDVPRANTIIIDDAPMYGLAQLYQLRGRVGRSASRAYAYLLYHPAKKITGDAQQRLSAIQEATELGAGFQIAMRDLEIRGAGNLLGPEQSGNIAAVGFDLYTQLLAQAVEQGKREQTIAANLMATGTARGIRDRSGAAKERMQRAAAVTTLPSTQMTNGPVTPIPLVTLDLPLTAFLPPTYVVDDALRLRVYQKLAEATTSAELRQLRTELRDRFGPLPQPADHLLIWLELKALVIRAGVPSVATNEEEIAIRLPPDRPIDRGRLAAIAAPEILKLGPQFARIMRRPAGDNWQELLRTLLLTLAGDS
ncbi:MAG: transcription-repair coupling factor [Herpetosiphon sp.]